MKIILGTISIGLALALGQPLHAAPGGIIHEVLLITGDPNGGPWNSFPPPPGGFVSTPSSSGWNGQTTSRGDLLVADVLSGVGPGNDDAIFLLPMGLFLPIPAPRELAMQEGDAAPAAGPGTFLNGPAGGPTPLVDAEANSGAIVGGVAFSALIWVPPAGGPPDSGVYFKAPGFVPSVPLINPLAPASGILDGTPAPGGLPLDLFDDFPDVTISPAGDVAFAAGILPGGMPGGGIGDETLFSGGVFGPATRLLTTSTLAVPSVSPVPVMFPPFFFQGPFSDVDRNTIGDVSFVNFLATIPNGPSAPPAGEGVHVFVTGFGLSPAGLIIGATGSPVPTPMAGNDFFSDITPLLPIGGGGTPPTLTDAGTVVCSVAYALPVALMPPAFDTGMVVINYMMGIINDLVREGRFVLTDGSALGDVSSVFFTVNNMGDFAFVNTRTGPPPQRLPLPAGVDASIVVVTPGPPVAVGIPVVIEGDPAPDAAGNPNGNFTTLAGPFISSRGVASAAGLVAFHATMTGTAGNTTDDEGIFVYIPPASPASPLPLGVCEVIREGATIPLPLGGNSTLVAPLDTTPELIWVGPDLYVVHDAQLSNNSTAVVRSRLDFTRGTAATITANMTVPSVEVRLPSTVLNYNYTLYRNTNLPVLTSFPVATQTGNGTDLIYTEGPPLAPKGFFQGTRYPDF